MVMGVIFGVGIRARCFFWAWKVQRNSKYVVKALLCCELDNMPPKETGQVLSKQGEPIEQDDHV